MFAVILDVKLAPGTNPVFCGGPRSEKSRLTKGMLTATKDSFMELFQLDLYATACKFVEGRITFQETKSGASSAY